jgi:hypothetical protein
MSSDTVTALVVIGFGVLFHHPPQHGAIQSCESELGNIRAGKEFDLCEGCASEHLRILSGKTGETGGDQPGG